MASTSSNTADAPPTSQADTSPDPKAPEQVLPLPPPPSDGDATKLDVSTGEAVKLDHLGPLVVNRDGTLSRISNWEQMSEIEKKNTLRILGKRNQLRRENLQAQEGVEQK
ncbi:hypothetical protein BS50DRAFT_589465 [Corynespora cassiicola Philippines]|uniref:Uncharacterized protein n=1 Tax=Corynespora cassiicola Philippines TaxID=1448308 RepID=A0A2T2NHY5_CORCC|nr:hypothetical protein BS50DRAFT_589465 [Corynespora cassiicola Philippines]